MWQGRQHRTLLGDLTSSAKAAASWSEENSISFRASSTDRLSYARSLQPAISSLCTPATAILLRSRQGRCETTVAIVRQMQARIMIEACTVVGHAERKATAIYQRMELPLRTPHLRKHPRNI